MGRRHKRRPKLRLSMLHTSESARNRTKEGRTAVFMVLLMLTSLMVSLVPAVSASHITQYAVQRDPAHLTVGDLNCDGHNDIVAVSVMGHYITALYNDGQGNFADRRFAARGVRRYR